MSMASPVGGRRQSAGPGGHLRSGSGFSRCGACRRDCAADRRARGRRSHCCRRRHLLEEVAQVRPACCSNCRRCRSACRWGSRRRMRCRHRRGRPTEIAAVPPTKATSDTTDLPLRSEILIMVPHRGEFCVPSKGFIRAGASLSDTPAEAFAGGFIWLASR